MQKIFNLFYTHLYKTIAVKIPLQRKCHYLPVKKYTYLLSLILFAFYSIPTSSSNKYQYEDFESNLGYFKQLTLGKYANNNDKKIIKWVNDINIYVKDKIPTSLDEELNAMIVEINGMPNNIKLRRVTSEKAANLLIFSKSVENYMKFEPYAPPELRNNTGGVWIYPNAKSEITHGSMYINTNTVTDYIYRKHIFRKLLTKSLGILYESPKYVDSIFAEQPFAQIVIEYSNFDKTIIKKLYSECVKAGMDKFELDHALLNEC